MPNQMSEMQRENIKKEAKQILDSFASALAKVKIKGRKNSKNLGGFREEGSGMSGNTEFRKKMFANAPNKNEDNIIAEKKQW